MKRYLMGCLFALSAVGCAVETGTDTTDGTSGSAADGAVDSRSSQVLAEIVLESNHRVKFIEATPGMVTIAETGFDNPDGALMEKLHLTRLREIYDALATHIDPAAQARLDAAQDRVDALNREVAALEAKGEGPTAEPPSHASVSQPSSGDVASKTSALTSNINTDQLGYGSPAIFNAAWCKPAGWDQIFCSISVTSATSGWLRDLTYIRTVVANPSVSSNVSVSHVQFVCVSSIFGICTKRDWRTQNTFVVGGHQYGYFTDTFKWTEFSASSSSTTFHMATGWLF